MSQSPRGAIPERFHDLSMDREGQATFEHVAALPHLWHTLCYCYTVDDKN